MLKVETQINHYAIQFKDLNRAVNYYESLLGLHPFKINKNEKGQCRSVWYVLGDSLLMLETLDQEREVKNNNTCFAFTIKKDDLDQWKDFMKSQKIVIHKESDYSLYFYDIEGNEIALSCFSFK